MLPQNWPLTEPIIQGCENSDPWFLRWVQYSGVLLPIRFPLMRGGIWVSFFEKFQNSCNFGPKGSPHSPDLFSSVIVKVIFMHLLGKLETCCIPIKESNGPFLGLLDLIDGKFHPLCKVQLFCEGHTHLKKIPQFYLTFDDFIR